MPNATKKMTQSANVEQLTIQAPATRTQVDFNSHEIREELEKVKAKIQTVLENANIDTQKLSIHFTV